MASTMGAVAEERHRKFSPAHSRQPAARAARVCTRAPWRVVRFRPSLGFVRGRAGTARTAEMKGLRPRAWLLRESKLPFRIEPARKPSEPWETFGSPIHLIAQGITIPPKAIAASGPSHPLDQSPGLRAFIQPARPALTPSATGSAMSGLASLLPHRPIRGPLWKERPNSGSETFSC